MWQKYFLRCLSTTFWHALKAMVKLWTVGHLHLKMLGVFSDVICQTILTDLFVAGSEWKGGIEATRENQCLIVRISRNRSSFLPPLKFTKTNAHTNSEMILGVRTWLNSSKSFMSSITSIEGFIMMSQRYSSLGHLNSTRRWLTCCSARLGIFITEQWRRIWGELLVSITFEGMCKAWRDSNSGNPAVASPQQFRKGE